MLLSKKYSKEFLSEFPKLKGTVERAVEIERKSNKDITKWNDDNVGEYLRSFHSVSFISLSNSLFALRTFVDYICEKENKANVEFFKDNDESVYEYIDMDRLLSITINNYEYMHIKNQIDDNIRNKVVFELFWSGLTTNMIKMLKEDDVKFEYNFNTKKEIAILYCQKSFEDEDFRSDQNGRLTITIEDEEIIEDIKKCIKEIDYIIVDKNGKKYHTHLRDSEYLIKPVNIGVKKTETYVSNISKILQFAFEINNVICEGIDLERLSGEAVRRSGLIYLLSPDNEDKYDLNLVAMVYGYSNENSLYWLKKVAKQKYKPRKESNKRAFHK